MQKYWKYWKHGSNNAWKQRITLSFCLKGTLRPNNSVQVYDSVEWQKHLIFYGSREKGKITKVAESKLVLDAEFLFTTFTLYLVLTAHVFCVALNQSKIPNGWLVDWFYRSIKPEKNSIWRLKIFCDIFTKSSEALKICLKNMFKCTLMQIWKSANIFVFR